MTIDEIRDNFALLDDWDDRYRYVIELGRTLDPMPEAEHSAANKVQGCASQVWLSKQVDRSDGEPLAELSRRQRRAYRARTDRDPADAVFRPHPAAHSCHRCAGAIRRARISRAPDAAALQRPAFHGRAHSLRRPRGAGDGFLKPVLRPQGRSRATSAAGAAGRAPSSWRAPNAPPRNSAPPSDSRPAGPICPGTAPASCCTGCADAASAT